ncbi:MAG TPA: hypothetical protein VMB77_15395 [Syntrophales bacterium]|nr:hypothetical protein [Syntrophales bacterium]
MRKTIAIIVSLSFTAGLLISCAAPTRVEMDYGTSHKLQIVNQTANPDAEKNLAPVQGMDSEASANTVKRYHKEFEKPEKAPSYSTSMGASGSSGSLTK